MFSFFWRIVNFFYLIFFSFGLPNEVILSAILFPIKYPAASAVFWTTRLETVFAGSFHFLLQYSLTFYIFITRFSSKWQKAISFEVFSKFRFCWISHFYKGYPIIIVKLILSSISSALLTWSVKQTSTKENSVLIVFLIVKQLINFPTCLFGTKVNQTFEACWQSFLTRLQCTKAISTDSIFGTFSQILSLATSFFFHFWTISLFQEKTFLICSLLLLWKQFCFWF